MLIYKSQTLLQKLRLKISLKKYRNLPWKTPYKVRNISLTEPTNAEDVDRADTIETLDGIASLQPGKSAQLATKKISQKYKKMREANRRKNIFKLSGEIVKIVTQETPQRNVEVPISMLNTSKIKTEKIRQNKVRES